MVKNLPDFCTEGKQKENELFLLTTLTIRHSMVQSLVLRAGMFSEDIF